MTGPLDGLRVLELGGMGPGPFAGMMLADLGARVIRVDRPSVVLDVLPSSPPVEVLDRGKQSIALDLKQVAGVDTFLRLVENTDALIDPYRPGVAERLGIGPEPCLSRRSSLVYARITGWGQSGPYASMAGHDINYIALTGALNAIGRAGGPPTPPLTLVGDFGGGGMLLTVGILAAIMEARSSGLGQIVDAASVDGAALLSSAYFGSQALTEWRDERGANIIDSGAPFYDVYMTADGRYVSIAAIEPNFYAELLKRLGLDAAGLPDQYDRDGWPALRERFASTFAERSLDEWCALLENTDTCFAPVLSFVDAPDHPQNRERGVFVSRDARIQPAPAPRFARTPSAIGGPAPHAGEHTNEILLDAGFSDDEIASLISGAGRCGPRPPLNTTYRGGDVVTDAMCGLPDLSYADRSDWADSWRSVVDSVGSDYDDDQPEDGADAIDASLVRRFLEPLEFECPLHHDRATAIEHGYSGVVAPSSGLATWISPGVWNPGDPPAYTSPDSNALPWRRGRILPRPGPPTDAIMATDIEYEYFAPIVVGDHLSRQGYRLLSCVPKDTSVGRGAFLMWESDVRNDRGELVARTRMGVFSYVARQRESVGTDAP